MSVTVVLGEPVNAEDYKGPVYCARASIEKMTI
jgi:hypothetical protein